jgi:hypothetical protein
MNVCRAVSSVPSCSRVRELRPCLSGDASLQQLQGEQLVGSLLRRDGGHRLTLVAAHTQRPRVRDGSQTAAHARLAA